MIIRLALIIANVVFSDGRAVQSENNSLLLAAGLGSNITSTHVGGDVKNATAVKTVDSTIDFHQDCSDPHNKEIACSVHVVDCNERVLDDVPSELVPPEAHDLRVEAFAKATARQERHQLHVDISWQLPPKQTSNLLRAFKLEVNGTDGDKCFAINFTDIGWTHNSASPRFHFTTESMFEFSKGYRVTLHSLPMSQNLSSTVIKETRMPTDPEINYTDDASNITQYCKTHTNVEASKWTAAFRRIFLQSITRTIQIEFVGAPPHFCFEEYEVIHICDFVAFPVKFLTMRQKCLEGGDAWFMVLHHTPPTMFMLLKMVNQPKQLRLQLHSCRFFDSRIVSRQMVPKPCDSRGNANRLIADANLYAYEMEDIYKVRLLDESGIELLHHTTIKARDMKKEIIDGKEVSFGEYNFTGLEYDVDYIPSVIPVELSSDGRCLCPTSEQSGACSCIAADWKRVRLQRVEKPAPVINVTMPTIGRASNDNKYWPLYAILILVLLAIALCAILTLFLTFYRKYTKLGKCVRIRFISDHMTNNGMVAAEPRTPLIYNYPTTVLLVYTHDCAEHDAVVLALAELLRHTFKMNVYLDVWDEDDIEKNLTQYINASIVKADKVVVINSLGAYFRVRARYLGTEVVERVHKSPLDGLFLSQIDLALQHARVISARFSYTSPNATLFALSPLLQYTIPDNLGLFVASLCDSQLRNDPRLVGYNPQLSRLQEAVANMMQLIEDDPKWFGRLHHRVPRTAATKIPPRSLDSGFASLASAAVVSAVQPSPLQSQGSGIEMPPSANGIVFSETPIEEDAKPLLEEDGEEMEVIEVRPSQKNTSADSALHSAVVVDDKPPELEVLDKPRLADPMRSNTTDQHRGAFVLNPDDKHHLTNRDDDSGLVSDLASGQVSA